MTLKHRLQKQKTAKRCSACGTALTDTDRFCPKCGTQYTEAVPKKHSLLSANQISQEAEHTKGPKKEPALKRILPAAATVFLSVIQIIVLSFTICVLIARSAAPVAHIPLLGFLSEEAALTVVDSFYSIVLGGILSAAVVLIILLSNLSRISRFILSVGVSLIFSGLLNLILMLYAQQQRIVYLIAVGALFAGAVLLFIYSCIVAKRQKRQELQPKEYPTP